MKPFIVAAELKAEHSVKNRNEFVSIRTSNKLHTRS